MDDIKLHILAEAEKLFMKYGIRSVTMDDIAKAIGISKKTIYVNFKDKNELVHELFSEMFNQNGSGIEQCSSDAKNAVEEVFGIMKFLKQCLAGVNPIVFYDLEKYHANTNQIMKEFKHQYILNNIIKTLERGIEEKVFLPYINIEILAQSRVKQIDWIFESDLVRSGKFSLYDVFLETTLHFLRGIATEQGNSIINEYKKTNI